MARHNGGSRELFDEANKRRQLTNGKCQKLGRGDIKIFFH
jgi:hypothetical protein